MSRFLKKTKGQIIIGVAVALFAMFGLLGLVFDFGWTFFLEKETQTAADAAAMATALEVIDTFGSLGPYDCTEAGVFCGSATSCPSSPAIGSAPATSLDSGCVYARRNGYWIGNPDRRQNVRIAAQAAGVAGATIVPPAAPGVEVFYWATAMVAEETPQIFSAILGNEMGVVSSSATAAIVRSIIPGSLWLLNRENDCLDMPQNNDCGIDLYVNANDQGCSGNGCGDDDYSLRVAGRIIASSQRDGSGPGPDDYAAVGKGTAKILSDDFIIRGTGNYNGADGGCPNCTWDVEPQNQGGPADPSDSTFLDPTEGTPNPPMVQPSLDTDFRLQDVAGGDLGTRSVDCDLDGTFPAGTADDPFIVPPGMYFATHAQGNNPPIANGEVITAAGSSNHYQFASCDGSFGEYVFVGGLEIAGTNVEFGPGRYVYYGSRHQGPDQEALQIHAGSYVTDGLAPNSPAPAGNAGQLHILAGPDYVGEDGRSVVDLYNETIASGNGQGDNVGLGTLLQGTQIDYARTEIQLGNSDGSYVNIHGLNPEVDPSNPDGLPDNLEPYRRFVMWQDRENSIINYNADGSYNCPTPNGTCANDDPRNPDYTELQVQASPDTHIYGIVYQPRGSYVTMTGGGGYSGPLQIITGAFQITGDAIVDLGILPFPLTQNIVALVQ